MTLSAKHRYRAVDLLGEVYVALEVEVSPGARVARVRSGVIVRWRASRGAWLWCLQSPFLNPPKWQVARSSEGMGVVMDTASNLVIQLEPGGAGAAAGLKEKDLITGTALMTQTIDANVDRLDPCVAHFHSDIAFLAVAVVAQLWTGTRSRSSRMATLCREQQSPPRSIRRGKCCTLLCFVTTYHLHPNRILASDSSDGYPIPQAAWIGCGGSTHGLVCRTTEARDHSYDLRITRTPFSVHVCHSTYATTRMPLRRAMPDGPSVYLRTRGWARGSEPPPIGQFRCRRQRLMCWCRACSHGIKQDQRRSPKLNLYLPAVPTAGS